MSQLPAGHPLIDQLRARWQQAIDESGHAAAAEDAAQAFVLRSGCSIGDGRASVTRAWQILAISR
jgi:hypothetical protein